MRRTTSLLLLILLSACGRLHFEPLHDAGLGRDDGGTPAVAVAVADASVDARITIVITIAHTPDASRPLACPAGFTGPTCSDCVRYVDAANAGANQDGLTWQTAISSLVQGAAIANAAACQLWVREGHYFVYETQPLDTVVLAPDAPVYGGFAGSERTPAERDLTAHASVIDGRDATRMQHVYHALTSTRGGTLDGFVVSEGIADAASPHDVGGGLTVTGGTMQLRNVTFLGNQAGGTGGAVHVQDAALRVENSSFMGNQADGSGGALALEGASVLTVSDVDVIGNVAGGEGGGIYLQASGTSSNVSLQNVVIAQNIAGGRGGGVVLRNTDCSIAACTIAGNDAGSSAGGIEVATGGTCTMFNSIVWNETAFPDVSAGIAIHHSLVRGGAKGTGNLADDPAFVNFPDDLHLSASSPAIDAADGCAGPTLDRAGAPRVYIPSAAHGALMGVATDMGAYEFQTGGIPTGSFATPCQ